MSLEIAPHPGKPGPDELIPSRYALRIVEIAVMVISDGVLPLPTEMLGDNVGSSVRPFWLNDMFLPADAFDWALNVMVVRSGTKQPRSFLNERVIERFSVSALLRPSSGTRL